MVKKNSYRVSVIVPVHGVAAFVERCVSSLMNQTLDEVEFIFIDDCTPDDSMSIIRKVIERHPERRDDCMLVAHERNLGLPAARNTGMKLASGDYVCHIDSDDFMEPDMLEKLYVKAAATDADMVWSDWFLSFDNNERRMSQPDAFTGREALSRVLAGEMKYNVWNKLTRRRLFLDNGIEFPSGRSMGEDMTMIRLMACAGSTAHVPAALYHYIRTNSGAMTQTYSDRHLAELKANVSETERYLLHKICDSEIEREINLFKLNVKLPFLFTGRRVDCRRWQQWYPESDRYILGNKRQSLRTRMLQWCAAAGMTWINIIYTRVAFDFIYGKIFK